MLSALFGIPKHMYSSCWLSKEKQILITRPLVHRQGFRRSSMLGMTDCPLCVTIYDIGLLM